MRRCQLGTFLCLGGASVPCQSRFMDSSFHACFTCCVTPTQRNGSSASWLQIQWITFILRARLNCAAPQPRVLRGTAPMPSSQSVSRLVRLSEIIARNSKLLNSHLIEKKLPQPSFSADAPPDGICIGKSEPRREELERAKRELVSATNELYDLSVGPRESVRNLAWDVSVNLLESPLVRAAYSMKKDCGMLLCHRCLQQKQSNDGNSDG